MARYTDEELNHLKSNISLLRLAESQGYALKKESKDYVMCCPSHDDKTPSLKITPVKNLFHCFGCGAGGSVIDWVIKTQGVSFRHAVELLKDDSSLAGCIHYRPVPFCLSMGIIPLNQVSSQTPHFA